MFECVYLGEEGRCGAVVDQNVKIPTLSRKKRGTRVGAPSIELPCFLADFFGPLLQILFHLRHELVGDRTVD
jgi:hypothetical protein